jgi:hypothetical protein
MNVFFTLLPLKIRAMYNQIQNAHTYINHKAICPPTAA